MCGILVLSPWKNPLFLGGKKDWKTKSSYSLFYPFRHQDSKYLYLFDFAKIKNFAVNRSVPNKTLPSTVITTENKHA